MKRRCDLGARGGGGRCRQIAHLDRNWSKYYTGCSLKKNVILSGKNDSLCRKNCGDRSISINSFVY